MPEPHWPQLLWRCRRGMKELDVLLERFARERYATAPIERRRAFERLLELPDPLLADYLLGHELPSDRDLAELVPHVIRPPARPGSPEP
ncbi:MAG TPA: succinate dehydrogenase assembly factor 2 [Steroidobacteraceae bacterium]|nr:succinate dehydrogenase assembly factor 2 [Steroidobacteraceae bacterium]